MLEFFNSLNDEGIIPLFRTTPLVIPKRNRPRIMTGFEQIEANKEHSLQDLVHKLFVKHSTPKHYKFFSEICCRALKAMGKSQKSC